MKFKLITYGVKKICHDLSKFIFFCHWQLIEILNDFRNLCHSIFSTLCLIQLIKFIIYYKGNSFL